MQSEKSQLCEEFQIKEITEDFLTGEFQRLDEFHICYFTDNPHLAEAVSDQRVLSCMVCRKFVMYQVCD